MPLVQHTDISGPPRRDVPVDKHSIGRFPTARAYLILSLGLIAFTFYGSLIPFRLEPHSFDSAWADFGTAIFNYPPRRLSRTDVLANLLLFVPLGFTLAGAMLVDRARRFGLIVATLVIVPLALGVSVLAEFLQTFTTDRVPSSVDIAAQTVGCLLGITLWCVAGNALTGWIRDTLSAAPADRLSRALTAFAAGWVFINLVPFDITLDLGDLGARVRSGEISLVPFTAPALWSARGAWDVLAETLSAVPLGVFGLVATGRRTPRWVAFARGAAIVALVEFAHVFISSHSASTTDLIVACIGVALGVAIGDLVVAKPVETASQSATRGLTMPALVAVVCWCLVLCAYHWTPFEFTMRDDEIRRKIARMSLLPFAGYQSGSDLNALSNLLTKLALAAPLGFATASALAAYPRAISIAFSVGFAAIVFAGIEMGQLFLPGRVPDPTDVLVGMAGAYAGLLLRRWLRPPEPPRAVSTCPTDAEKRLPAAEH